MTTYPWAILFVAPVVVSVTSATAAPAPPQNIDKFVIHKAQGDKARASGNLSAAFSSYEKALAIRYDPVVWGLVGVVLLAAGKFDGAAHQLHPLINEKLWSLSERDRRIFSKAYSDALQKVCRVDFSVDHVRARVEIDGMEKGQGRANFWVFVMPGDHVIRARLPGFQDAIEGFVAEEGCPRSTIALVMQPEPIKSSSSVVMTKVASEIKTNDHNEPLPVRPESLYGDTLATNPLKISSDRRFVVGGGALIAFGVTPGVALGVQLQGSLRSLSQSEWWWDVGAGVRFAGTIGSGRYGFGSVYTWTALLVPCVRYGDHLFGGILMEMNGGGLDLSNTRSFPGAGIRAGYEFHPNNRFSFVLSGDFELRFGSPKIDLSTHKEAGNGPVPAFVANALTFF